jgi:hypothetical protein
MTVVFTWETASASARIDAGGGGSASALKAHACANSGAPDQGLHPRAAVEQRVAADEGPLRSAVRAERHFVPHRAFIVYGPSQLNAVLDRR